VLQTWGDFGKSWELKKSYIALTLLYYHPFFGYPKRWTKKTNGLKDTAVVLIKAADPAALEGCGRASKGKLVLPKRNDTLKQCFITNTNRGLLQQACYILFHS